MTSERDLSAIHESAHVVAYWAYCIELRKIWLTDAGGGWTRVTCEEHERNSFERIVALLAGEVAAAWTKA
jgi:hypothetical protein